ncbi:MAG: hypothetical protein H6719_28595 [Sandaracinaceae bacterium]|nr:hypothetical protein [Sandaracinaceae bacterium]
MRISVKHPREAGRVQLHVLTLSSPWRVTYPGHHEEALLDATGRSPGFLAEGYPDWLRDLCEPIDADRQLAEAIVKEVGRRR